MRRACVIGHPVAHSRSPLIHRHWLKEHRIDGTYGREDVKPWALDHFLASLPERDYVGGNVTVPHKEAAFRAARVDDPVALVLGAVNTLWIEKGVLRGANTDVAGFLANLDEAAPDWSEKLDVAVVLGAGGAARAVVHALLSRGAGRIVVVNRTRERAQALADALDPARIEIADWEAAPDALGWANLLVNTTSLGMEGQPPLALDLSPLPDGTLVTDIVYAPLETPLLKLARARDLPTVEGLGMLLHQAVPGFERWFGVRPKVTKALRDLVAADIFRAAHD